MTKNPLLTSTAALSGSVISGALISALVPYWVFNAGILFNPSSLLSGALFGFMGWILAENLGDAVVVLMGTAFPGLIVISYLDNEIWRTLTIAFICGFNAGKLIGSIHREFT